MRDLYVGDQGLNIDLSFTKDSERLNRLVIFSSCTKWNIFPKPFNSVIIIIDC